MTTSHRPVRAVAGSMAGIDVLLLLLAGFLALHTEVEISTSGDSGFESFGYLFAGLIAAVALPSLLLAVVALRARGAAAVACAILSVLVLVGCAVFAVSWI